MSDDNNGAKPAQTDEEKALALEERKLKLELLKADVWKKRIGVLSAVFRILPTPKEAPLLWIALIGTLGGGGVKAGLHFFGMDNPALFNVNNVPRVEAPAALPEAPPPAAAPTPSTENIVASVEATVAANREIRREERRARRTETATAAAPLAFSGTGRGGGGTGEGTIGIGLTTTVGHGAALAVSEPAEVVDEYIVMDTWPEEPEQQQMAIEVNAGQVILIPHDGHTDKIKVEPQHKHVIQEPEGYSIQYTELQVERWLFGHKVWTIFWLFFIGGAWEVWRIRRRKKKEKAQAAEIAEEDEMWHTDKGDKK